MTEINLLTDGQFAGLVTAMSGIACSAGLGLRWCALRIVKAMDELATSQHAHANAFAVMSTKLDIVHDYVVPPLQSLQHARTQPAR